MLLEWSGNFQVLYMWNYKPEVTVFSAIALQPILVLKDDAHDYLYNSLIAVFQIFISLISSISVQAQIPIINFSYYNNFDWFCFPVQDQ